MKLTLAVAMMLGATSLFAQKFGQIDMQALLLSMPETKGRCRRKWRNSRKISRIPTETMNVEFNTKYQDYMKNMNTLPESTRQIKEKELNELKATAATSSSRWPSRIRRRSRRASWSRSSPRHREAVNQVSKSGGYTGIFQTGTMAYLDAATVT